MDGPNFEFYVLNYDFNRKKIINFNIFNNVYVYDCALKETKKHLRNRKKYPFESYVHELRGIIMWQEWGRREYEISVGDAFEDDINKYKKIDCFYQAEPNMEIIANMCIQRYREYCKEQKEKKQDERSKKN